MPSLFGTSVALILYLCPLDFSNILTKTAIERLADADEYEAVREVQVIPYLWHAHLHRVNARY
jgi:hypothetical protein